MNTKAPAERVSGRGGRWLCLVAVTLASIPSARAADPAAVVQFLNRYPGWRLADPSPSGQIESFEGPPVPFAARDAGAAEIDAAARRWVQDQRELLGFNSRFLVALGLEELSYLSPESQPKRAYSFTQIVYGRRVIGARLVFVLDDRGNLLAVHNRGVVDLDRVPVTAAQTYASAFSRATQDFGWFERSSETELVIYPRETARGVEPKLAYLLELRRDAGSAGLPDQRRYFIDALSGELLASQSSVVSVGLEGTVQGYGLPTLWPYAGSQSTALIALPDVRLSSAVGTAITDAQGRFRIPVFFGGGAPVRAQLGDGPSLVRNRAGTDAVIEQMVAPGTAALFTFNQERSEERTAEVAFHVTLSQLRRFVHDVNPNDRVLDAPIACNVNVRNTCNAFFDGNSVNFFAAGGGCPNTAYSTIIAHELGHVAAARYLGLVSGAFGEGYADTWAMYVYDDPIVGRNFFGPGTVLRDGRNARMACGDGSELCHGGEVHDEGEVLMGAFWKMRDRLNQSLGDAPGDAVADALLLAWSRAFADAKISPAIENHLLLLDDNDGNPANGTPHFAAIDGAFRAQGFPGFQVERVRIVHEPVAESQTSGAVTVVARVEDALSPVDEVRVYYSTGGAFSSVLLAPTRNRNEWQGTIPGVAGPAVVQYYLWARDRDRFEARCPPSAPDDDRFLYYVGKLEQLAVYRFDGPSDEGWTHLRQLTEDDWQRGVPRGRAGDPTAAFSGTMCFGNDLGAAPGDGTYRDGARNVLRSPFIALGSATGTHLQFRRWLTVEPHDRARILVNDRRVWESPATREIKDSAWTLQDLDVSGIADPLRSLTVQFELESDGAGARGGWNIDDVRVLTLGVISQYVPCREPAFYGAGTMGSGGYVPEIAGYGLPRLGSTIRVVGSYLRGGTSAVLVVGTTPLPAGASSGLPLLVNLAGPPRGQILPAAVAGPSFPGFGVANLAVPLPNQAYLEGTDLHFQWVVLDPGAPLGVATSRAMKITLCNR